MMNGTPQDQIPSLPPSLENSADADSPGAIPVQAVDADQLPREKGWTYEEFASIVGSLYLDTHHAMKVREEQFQAVSEEYQRHVMRLQAEIQGKQSENEHLTKQVATLRRELELRNARHPTTSGDDGGH